MTSTTGTKPWSIVRGDCADVLRMLPHASCDSLITDPPAAISFTGREWDSDKGGRDQWVGWLKGILEIAFHVLKPGAHGLIWSLPRTAHWTALAAEDAGFTIKGKMYHHFGQGWNKSSHLVKPATEEWLFVQVPISEKTIKANIEKWGTGTLNLDECRVETQEPRLLRDSRVTGGAAKNTYGGSRTGSKAVGTTSLGRVPADVNFTHAEGCTDDECVGGCPVHVLDEQGGYRKSGHMRAGVERQNRSGFTGEMPAKTAKETYGDEGQVSRYFYQSKSPRSERDAGLEDFYWRVDGEAACGFSRVSREEWEQLVEQEGGDKKTRLQTVGNIHSTVKPIGLCRHFVKLITPDKGVVLDPFAGSGSIGCAAVLEGRRFIGIEQDHSFCEIAEARIEHWMKEKR